MRPKELMVFLQSAFTENETVLIKGKPGIGKSDIVSAAAKAVGANLMISHPVVSDPTDYKGLPFPGKEGVAHFQPFGDLYELTQAKSLTIFFLDDLGQAPASVQAAVMQLLLARRVNGHRVSDHVVFVAATNRREDKAGVTGMLEPVKSRFSSIVELTVHTEDWVEWAFTHDMPSELISFIQFRPQLLEDFKPTNDMVNTPSPRTVAAVGRMQKKGFHKIGGEKDSLWHEIISGAAGKGFASEYMAFLHIYKDLPTIGQIVAHPETTPVPKEPSAQYALAGSLAERASVSNIGPIVKYLKRVPGEINVVFLKNASFSKPEICGTEAYIDCASANAYLF